jgi:hypothetical protein
VQVRENARTSQHPNEPSGTRGEQTFTRHATNQSQPTETQRVQHAELGLTLGDEDLVQAREGKGGYQCDADYQK